MTINCRLYIGITASDYTLMFIFSIREFGATQRAFSHDKSDSCIHGNLSIINDEMYATNENQTQTKSMTHDINVIAKNRRQACYIYSKKHSESLPIQKLTDKRRLQANACTTKEKRLASIYVTGRHSIKTAALSNLRT